MLLMSSKRPLTWRKKCLYVCEEKVRVRVRADSEKLRGNVCFAIQHHIRPVCTHSWTSGLSASGLGCLQSASTYGTIRLFTLVFVCVVVLSCIYARVRTFSHSTATVQQDIMAESCHLLIFCEDVRTYTDFLLAKRWWIVLVYCHLQAKVTCWMCTYATITNPNTPRKNCGKN